MAITETNQLCFEDVNGQIVTYIKHPFLRASGIRQVMSRFHFDVGLRILRAANVSESDIAAILQALLLLDHGLSIHDEVENQSDLKRQLNVLAGDYSSGWYYWVMARLDHPALLVAWCHAVAQINEAKMLLTASRGTTLSPEKYLELQETRIGGLLYSLAKVFLPSFERWVPQIRSLVRAYILNDELDVRDQTRHLTLRQAYDWLTDAIERTLHAPTSALIEPLSGFAMEYLSSLKTNLESHSFAEGNRS